MNIKPYKSKLLLTAITVAANSVALCLSASADPTAAPIPAPAETLPPGESTAPVALPEGVSSTWWQEVQQQIAASEYEVSLAEDVSIAAESPETPAPDAEAGQKAAATAAAPTSETLDLGDVLQAPNRAQNLRTYFTNGGPLITPRTEDGPQWRLSLEFSGIGNPDQADAKAAPSRERTARGLKRVSRNAKPVAEQNELRYELDGITEWYENNEAGLKQNFTINAPQSDSDTLALDIEVTGDLLPFVMQNGDEVEFRDANGVSNLQYTNLYVHDANDTALTAHFEVTGDTASTIRIVVDAKDAIYPVTVDPLVSTTYWAINGFNDGDGLGSAMASGDINGDGYADLAVTARTFGSDDRGKAYLFLGGPGGLASMPVWTREGAAGSRLGWSADMGDVDADGLDDLAIGASWYKNTDATPATTNAGKVEIFYGKSNGVLSATPNWTATTSVANTFMGSSVEIGGDYNKDGKKDVAVGTRQNNEAGSVHVWYTPLPASGTVAPWISTGLAGSELGGYTLTSGDADLDGDDDLLAGARKAGKVYLYNGAATSGLPTAAGEADEPTRKPSKIFSESGSTYFGGFMGLAILSDIEGTGLPAIVIGNSRADSGKGKFYVYQDTGAGIPTNATTTITADVITDGIGQTLSSAGDVNGDGFTDLVVNFENNEQVRIYFGSAQGFKATNYWARKLSTAQEGYGTELDANDFNGDGFSDIAIGAFEYGTTSKSGRAEAWYGSAAGPESRADWFGKDAAPKANGHFGTSVAGGGDINGDGFDDVLIGSPAYDNGTTKGRVYAFAGSASGLSTSPLSTMESDLAGKEVQFAWSSQALAIVGNVDGDAAGCDDVLIGAPNYDSGSVIPESGRAWLYRGSPEGLIETPWTTIIGAVNNGKGGQLGYAVSGLGDINGDGFSDIAVSAPRLTVPNINILEQGEVLVYLGSNAGLKSTSGSTPKTAVVRTDAHWRVRSGQQSSMFGSSLSYLGDVNEGNRYPDLLIGAALYDGNIGGSSVLNNTGAAYIVLAGSNGEGFGNRAQDARITQIVDRWEIIGPTRIDNTGSTIRNGSIGGRRRRR